jgi:hypothetical protein
MKNQFFADLKASVREEGAVAPSPQPSPYQGEGDDLPLAPGSWKTHRLIPPSPISGEGARRAGEGPGNTLRNRQHTTTPRRPLVALAVACLMTATQARADEDSSTRVYENQLKPIKNPQPLLADFPQFVEPVREVARFAAPILIDDPGADLDVRAWRFSYNARAIIEVPNRLRADRTAVIVVHPWAIDDGQGWRTPEPAGVAFQCTPAKNKIVLDHAATVINPFLKALRSKARVVAYSLPGTEDPIRKKIYRSFRSQPDESDRQQGQRELKAKLAAFPYRGQAIPQSLTVSADRPTIGYFKQFAGLDSGPAYEGPGFWELPIPVMNSIDVDLRDVVIYDAEGYPALREFLKKQGVRHVLLAGYNTDMCVCSTTAGYKNLAQDFDVFLVGDATIATFPAQPTPRFATTSSVCFAALNLFITQASWVSSVKVSPNRR